MTCLSLIVVGYVNGQEMQSDAHSVAEHWGLDYRLWASIWLIMSFISFVVGIAFAFDAKALNWSKPTTTDVNDTTVVSSQYTASANAPYTAYLA
jgi:hypothetical protein